MGCPRRRDGREDRHRHRDRRGDVRVTVPSSCRRSFGRAFQSTRCRPHIVHLSDRAIAVLGKAKKQGKFVFSAAGSHPFQGFSNAKRELDAISGVTGWRLHDLRRTCVSGMAGLGVAPHVADKILNHQSGTISGVAAVYQRHQFLSERKDAIEKWGAHIAHILSRVFSNYSSRRVA